MKAKAASRMLLALSACLAAAGCRTAGVSPSQRPSAPVVTPEPKLSFHLDEFVREHNQNANRIQTVRANPSIAVTMAAPDGGRGQSGSVYGRLAVVRPHDFKLTLESRAAGVNLADMGSNQDEFWFWVKNDDKYVFRCAYEDLPKSELSATYQPDWIVSALGLRPITRDEAAAVRILPGVKPGTTLLRLPPLKGEGSAGPREMVVDEATNRMLEYRVFDRDGKTLLGEAKIKHYADVALKSTVATDADAPPPPATCHIPDKLVLEWKVERLTLDISMSSPPKINQEIPEAQRTVLFVLPEFSGATTMNLAEMSRTRPRGETGGDTTVRETLPAPEPSISRRGTAGNGVSLGPPVEIQGARLQSADDPEPAPRPRAGARPASRRSAPRATPAPLVLPVFNEVVGAAPPRLPQSPFQQTASAADLIESPTIER
ncbi:hypothetical protein [Paludisphaera mucosa]|uniref:Uncharacterized protein n=1 Tax=Paludisphaera mucosa TaxID=3030827 RepID=A0ABT6FAS6_9BACT|nr:hypothetical protein [Paludisphaera mucosa]MDG3004534.1 hypothetical protein [Paludisphaera mucosa]